MSAMGWILVVWLTGSPTLTTIPRLYETEKQCIEAGTKFSENSEWRSTATGMTREQRFACFPAGSSSNSLYLNFGR